MAAPIKQKLVLIAINFSVFIALVLVLEMLVRLAVPAVQSQGMDANLVLFDRFGNTPGLKPGAEGIAFGRKVQVNEMGFRKSTTPFSKTKKTRLFLGDSVTMGVGVEDDSVYVARMDKVWTDVNVVNPSVIGWGAENYLEAAQYLLEKEINALNIDHITVAWCLNDIYRGLPPEEYQGMQIKNILHRYTTWLRENSNLYIFLKGIFFDRQKSYFEFDRQFYNSDDPNMKSAIAQMAELASLCETHDVALDVLFLPYEYQLRNSDNPEMEIPFSFMQEQLGENGIPLLDGRKAFPPDQDSKSFYLFADGIHFSNSGHRHLAEFLIGYNSKN